MLGPCSARIAATIGTRRWSSPETLRRLLFASPDTMSPCTSANSGRRPSMATVTAVPGVGER